MASTGVVIDDFNQIAADMNRSVTFYVSTKTVDNMGVETTTFTNSTQSMVFFLHNNKFLYDEYGLTEVGDAYAMIPLTLNAKRYDKIAVDGDTYYIENVTRRVIVGVAQFDYAVLFKVA